MECYIILPAQHLKDIVKSTISLKISTRFVSIVLLKISWRKPPGKVIIVIVWSGNLVNDPK